jgi:hypothetical protein
MFLFRVTCFHLCKSYVSMLRVFYMNLGEKGLIKEHLVRLGMIKHICVGYNIFKNCFDVVLGWSYLNNCFIANFVMNLSNITTKVTIMQVV